MTDIDGFDELADDLERFAEAVDDAETQIESTLDGAVEKTSLQVLRGARQRVPIDTGNLRNSILNRRVAPMKYSVGTNVEYAPYVERGTSPHIIRPDGDALVFESGGETVFAARVEHPGTEPQPYLRPALLDAQDDLADNIEAAIQELLDEAFDL